MHNNIVIDTIPEISVSKENCEGRGNSQLFEGLPGVVTILYLHGPGKD